MKASVVDRVGMLPNVLLSPLTVEATEEAHMADISSDAIAVDDSDEDGGMLSLFPIPLSFSVSLCVCVLALC